MIYTFCCHFYTFIHNPTFFPLMNFQSASLNFWVEGGTETERRIAGGRAQGGVEGMQRRVIIITVGQEQVQLMESCIRPRRSHSHTNDSHLYAESTSPQRPVNNAVLSYCNTDHYHPCQHSPNLSLLNLTLLITSALPCPTPLHVTLLCLSLRPTPTPPNHSLLIEPSSSTQLGSSLLYTANTIRLFFP